jgi:hypothetical protein
MSTAATFLRVLCARSCSSQSVQPRMNPFVFCRNHHFGTIMDHPIQKSPKVREAGGAHWALGVLLRVFDAFFCWQGGSADDGQCLLFRSNMLLDTSTTPTSKEQTSTIILLKLTFLLSKNTYCLNMFDSQIYLSVSRSPNNQTHSHIVLNSLYLFLLVKSEFLFLLRLGKFHIFLTPDWHPPIAPERRGNLSASEGSFPAPGPIAVKFGKLEDETWWLYDQYWSTIYFNDDISQCCAMIFVWYVWFVAFYGYELRKHLLFFFNIAKVLGQFIICIVTSAIFSCAPRCGAWDAIDTVGWMMGIMVYTI